MNIVTALGISKGAFFGIGAGLTLIVLLVLQSLVGSGLLSTRLVTITTTAAVSTVPDAYEQVASSYANHLLLLDSRKIPALVTGYESNATVEWKGAAIGMTGNYTGSGNIGILHGSFTGKFIDLSLSNLSQMIGSKGNHWMVNSTFSLHGTGSVVGNFNATIAAQDSYIRAGETWLISHETWNFLSFNVQYPHT
jgi:hypothetical protein